MAEHGEPWIAVSDVIPMFPTLVWKIELKAALRDEIDAKMLAALAELRRGLPALAAGQGWQSEQTLHERAEFRELMVCAGRAAKSILHFLHVGYEEMEVTACWATVLATGAEHHLHSHPNNFLSGVYYLRVEPGADTIYFHDPRSQAGIIRPPVTALTAENTDQVVVPVAEGTLLLFPSYLAHSVPANTGDGERISVSFNLMFPAFAENLSKPLW